MAVRCLSVALLLAVMTSPPPDPLQDLPAGSRVAVPAPGGTPLRPGASVLAANDDEIASLPPELLTVAEASGYRATARHREVVALLDTLAARSPLLRRGRMGETLEGREIALLVASDPPVGSAEEARESGKVVVLVFGGIHAGEVCGKEALPMLAREIALAPDRPDLRAWLERLVIVFAPLYNADGNERVSTSSRPEQDGPEQGQGQRPNAQGLDLNRDYVKLHAPETRAMVALLNAWDPHVVIDTHTTNGSFHRYLLTYAPPLNPSGHPGPIDFVREELLPAVGERLAARTGWDTFLYGNFEPDHGTWATYSALPRFGAQYHGLRGRLSILTEAYSHAPYRERVLVTREFVRECLDLLAARAGDVAALIARADADACALGTRAAEAPRIADADADSAAESAGTASAAARDDASRAGAAFPRAGRAPAWEWPARVQPALATWRAEVGVRHALAEAPEPAVIKGWVETEDEQGRVVPTGEPRDYPVRHLDRFAPVVSVPRPAGYLLGPGTGRVREVLALHGVQVVPWTGGAEADVELWRVVSVRHAEQPSQGHRLASVEAERRTARQAVGEEVVFVPMGQPLGTLAAYLLEPLSEDGVLAWNLLDEHLQPGTDLPVWRLPAARAPEPEPGAR